MFNWFEKFSSRPRILSAGLSLAAVAIIGFVDYSTAYELSFAAFYLIPIGLATWFVGWPFGIFVSVTSVMVSLVGDMASGASLENPFVSIWNEAILVTFYFVVIWLLTNVHAFQRELERRVRQRTVELNDQIAERERVERELLSISEREKMTIGSDLHDNLGQHLTATAFASQVLAEQLAHKSLPESAAAKHVVKLVEEGISLTQMFARSLSPFEMTDSGFIDGLQELAYSTSKQFQVSCELNCHEPFRLKDSVSGTELYRIVQEAITNAIRHGKAKRIDIRLEEIENALTVTVTDDGTGLPGNVRNGKGLGLRIMTYRANRMGATFNIERLAEGGTRVTCKCPPIEGISAEANEAGY
jgi:signal transduction histidine kinase